MQGIHNISIKRKLIYIIMLTSMVALLLTSTVFVVYDLITLRQTLVQDISMLSQVMSANSTAALSFNDRKAAEENLEAFHSNPHIVASCIYNNEGGVFASYIRSDMIGRLSLPAPQDAGYHFGSDYLTMFRRVDLDNKPIGLIYVQYDLEELHSRMQRNIGVVIIIFLSVSCITFVVSSRLQRVISLPILTLAKTAKLISQEKRFSIRAEKHGQDEIGVLIDGFNEMLSEIQRRDAELELHREVLEVQVANRTAELSTVNNTLLAEVQERTRAEEALRIAEQTFRDLLETVQLVAILLDSDGNITFCNDYLLHLTGWGKKELLGQNWVNLAIPESEREKMRAIFSSLLRGEKDYLHYENNIATRKGNELLISWNNTALHDLEGKIAGTASIGIDITAQKHLEAQLRQAQKMEAVGQLAGGIAHDFNNILSAIVGYAYLVQARLNSGDPSKEDMDQILESAHRAAEVTHSLLAFSKKQSMNSQLVRIVDIVTRSKKMLSRLIGEDVTINIAISCDEVKCRVDAGQVEQVLMNLATNARDAMPHGGRLTISTECVEMDESFIASHGYGRSGRFVLISVSDSGVGMSRETAAKIFEPFFTTKETGKGTGLGLAMAYGIIKQHDGYIDVHSEPGKGTTFNIYLPAVESKEEIAVKIADLSPTGGTETILVTEDDEKLRRLSEIVLKQYGYKVILAQDGEEAIEKFNEDKDRIDLVLLDMIMPKKSGKDVYDEIKRVKPDMKVIFVSGYTADRIDKQSMIGENVTFIFKPVAPKDLLMQIRDMLDK